MNEKISPLSLPKDYALGMKKQPKYKWYKPILAALLAIVFYAVFIFVVTLGITLLSILLGDASVYQSLMSSGSGDNYMGFDGDNAGMLAISFLGIAVAIPAIGLAVKICGIGGFGSLTSVENKMRWKRIGAIFPVALLVSVCFIVVEVVLSLALGEDVGELRFPVIAIVVIVICCPLQCAAEEYMCRGFLMQAFSSWIPIVVIPMILQALVFTVLHGYDALGLVSILVTGLITGYLTLKTGGLEAGICLHVANNVPAFILSAILVEQQISTSVDPISFAIDLTMNIIFLVVIYAVCKRKGYLIG